MGPSIGFIGLALGSGFSLNITWGSQGQSIWLLHFHLYSSPLQNQSTPSVSGDGHKIKHRVTEEDNKLSVGEPFLGGTPSVLTDVDLYAVEKELYLASKCQVDEPDQKPWHFWMVMLKNGNMDTLSGLCPKDGHKVGPFPPEPRFPCFGKGCMNQPLLFHEYTSLQEDNTTMKGSFYGTYDLDADLSKGFDNISYHNVTWKKEVGKGSWVFHHVLKTSEKYPWLMLYLRSDATTGLSGGYSHQTRGMTRIVSSFRTRKSLFLSFILVCRTIHPLLGSIPSHQLHISLCKCGLQQVFFPNT